MKRFVLTLSAVIFLATPSTARTKNSDDKCSGLNEKVVVLVNQYKELRERRRQLPPCTFDEDLSADGGKLSRVLSSLGSELGHSPYTKQNIVGCLGAPDAVKSHRQMGRLLDIYNRELKKSGRKVEASSRREYLIYFWRGWHDFLFFISEGGVIVDHGWWFAYE
ncbi:MAG TPA: hypothetical protein VJT09_11665 [Pyrinomonadaceae bacterium]|nr:hypothetical protein [Pyrinomonadaceae bacterium]